MRIIFLLAAHLLKSFLSDANRQADRTHSTTPDEPFLTVDPLILPGCGVATGAARRGNAKGKGFDVTQLRRAIKVKPYTHLHHAIGDHKCKHVGHQVSSLLETV